MIESILITFSPCTNAPPRFLTARIICAAASIGWHCASCGYKTPNSTFLEINGSNFCNSAPFTSCASIPAARCKAASFFKSAIPFSLLETTTPPLSSNSKPPSISAFTSNQASRDLRAKVNSGLGSLSETKIFPSPAPVVPLATGPRSITKTFNPAFVKASALQAPTTPAPMTIASGDLTP
ncbi:unannotated protein [freshwater metagenome]|uniref:Unannotated protein n=1 Tax=freshwater metagenome TaxID=449393 RepID=A0A6J6YIJ7_9ZZZZ